MRWMLYKYLKKMCVLLIMIYHHTLIVMLSVLLCSWEMFKFYERFFFLTTFLLEPKYYFKFVILCIYVAKGTGLCLSCKIYSIVMIWWWKLLWQAIFSWFILALLLWKFGFCCEKCLCSNKVPKKTL